MCLSLLLCVSIGFIMLWLCVVVLLVVCYVVVSFCKSKQCYCFDAVVLFNRFAHSAGPNWKLGS